jgi:hypothetical protein
VAAKLGLRGGNAQGIVVGADPCRTVVAFDGAGTLASRAKEKHRAMAEAFLRGEIDTW